MTAATTVHENQMNENAGKYLAFTLAGERYA